MVYQVYFGGGLFDHKQLIGNRLLAEAIDAAAPARYQIVLPQEFEPSEQRALNIRNNDFRLLLETQAAIFNFDGTELDSGTVVEFMVAKMLDLPSVILRTDFRHAGDQDKGGDAWNLMCSGYPRTVGVTLNAMEIYHRHWSGNMPSENLLNDFYRDLGGQIIRQLDQAFAQPSHFTTAAELSNAYRHVLLTVGGGLTEMLPEGFLAQVVNRRLQ